MHNNNTTYLITGANRGIGRGLVAAYLAQPNTTVIAAVRGPNHTTSKSLWTLSKGASSKLVVIRIDSASKSSVTAAIEELQAAHNVGTLDVVIANAGISKCYPPVAEVTVEDVQEHFLINTIGPLVLFQAVLPLMKESTQPKFVAISSAAGSIGSMGPGSVPNAAYGPSKAALNYLTRKMHFENNDLIAFPIDPGWVQTDMGNSAAIKFGVPEADISLEKSVEGLVAVIDGATREKTSGHFSIYNGELSPW